MALNSTAISLENSTTWDNSQWKTFFIRRLQNMRTKRKTIEQTWALADEQIKAESFYDNMGVLNVNVPHEKVLGEIYMGRTE